MPGLVFLVKKNWFLIGILGSVFLAEVYPPLGSTGGNLQLMHLYLFSHSVCKTVVSYF